MSQSNRAAVILSSQEGIRIASEVESALSRFGVETDRWDRGMVPAGQPIFGSIQQMIEASSAAVLVMSPDDETISSLRPASV
jgi:predicted nucleotide-binding protein